MLLQKIASHKFANLHGLVRGYFLGNFPKFSEQLFSQHTQTAASPLCPSLHQVKVFPRID